MFRENIIAHAALGKLFPEMPVILTTSHEQGMSDMTAGSTRTTNTNRLAPGPNGPVIPEILNMYPNVPVIKRVGELDAWDSAQFRDALRGTGRSQVILAGIATDVCTYRLPPARLYPQLSTDELLPSVSVPQPTTDLRIRHGLLSPNPPLRRVQRLGER